MSLNGRTLEELTGVFRLEPDCDADRFGDAEVVEYELEDVSRILILGQLGQFFLVHSRITSRLEGKATN